jgi:hypothetical protein
MRRTGTRAKAVPIPLVAGLFQPQATFILLMPLGCEEADGFFEGGSAPEIFRGVVTVCFLCPFGTVAAVVGASCAPAITCPCNPRDAKRNLEEEGSNVINSQYLV